MNRNLRTTRSVILTTDQHFHSYGEGRKVGDDSLRFLQTCCNTRVSESAYSNVLGIVTDRCYLTARELTHRWLRRFLHGKYLYYTQRGSRTGLFYKVIILGRPNLSSPISCRHGTLIHSAPNEYMSFVRGGRGD